MIIREICPKTILSRSGVYDWTVNPYRGCQHACAYCYARFMTRFTGHPEPWGQFVDVKVTAPELLEKEVPRKPPGRVWISGVCDPYQPVEEKYRLTRRCLEVLIRHKWPFTIQTKSPLVARDIDLLGGYPGAEVGMTVTTADDRIRGLFEPGAPPVMARIKALQKLHEAGIKTFVMVAPMLPGAEGLDSLLPGATLHALVDRMNYHYADWLYRKLGLGANRSDEASRRMAGELCRRLEKAGVGCERLF